MCIYMIKISDIGKFVKIYIDIVLKWKLKKMMIKLSTYNITKDKKIITINLDKKKNKTNVYYF